MKPKILYWPVTAALFELPANGCTTHELSRNIYEGIKTHND